MRKSWPVLEKGPGQDSWEVEGDDDKRHRHELSALIQHERHGETICTRFIDFQAALWINNLKVLKHQFSTNCLCKQGKLSGHCRDP